MKTTRRDFLKGLFATGATLAVAPHLLVEPVHGASDLTPQERDVAAEVMGLRRKQWRGAEVWHPKTLRRTIFGDGCVMTDSVDDWEIENSDLVVFPEAKTELLIDGEWKRVESKRPMISIPYPVAYPGGSNDETEIRFGQVTVPSGTPVEEIRALIGTLPPLRARWVEENVPRVVVDNEYDPEANAIHLAFGEWTTVFKSRELRPEPGKSPFVRLLNQE